MNKNTLWLTVSDRRFFPGTLATINSILRFHPDAEIAVVESGVFNQPLSEPQRKLLLAQGITIHEANEFAKPGRVLGAWQLKAYAACDLSDGRDLIIGIDSDAVLCSNVDDVAQMSLADGKFRGGKDGNGTGYGTNYAPYGFEVPVRNPSYMSTSLYFAPITDMNRAILEVWAACCDTAVFGPQKEKVFPGHGDQGVLNAVIYKQTRGQNLELLENHLFSQHGVYWTDVIQFEEGRVLNHTAGRQPMRGLHCGGTEKFWSPRHRERLLTTGQSQVWSYAYWLWHLWFGKATDLTIDPMQWMPEESRHLCQDLAYYYDLVEAVEPDPVRQKWALVSDAVLDRLVEGVPRLMSLGSSMTKYIELARALPDYANIVEVGSYRGGSVVTLAVALLHKRVRVTALEPFTGSLNGTMDGRELPVPREYFQNVKGRFPHLNVNTIQLDSVKASEKFMDGSLDMVFIDANHTVDAVIKDIALWWPKLKVGGILAGDDIGWQTVKVAVTKAFGDSFQSSNFVWWVAKQPNTLLHL